MQARSVYFLLLFGILFTQSISIAQNDKLYIPLYSSSANYNIIENVKTFAIAPDYNANVKITILPNKVFRNDKVDFQINIEDTGIIKMKKPYYYVFLVDSQKNIVSSLPESTGIYYNYGYQNSKWQPWVVESVCDFQGQTKDTIALNVNESKWYISRNALLLSNGWMYYVGGNQCYSSTRDLVFTAKTNNFLGTWQIHVFVFDAEPYCTRNSNGETSCWDTSNKLVKWDYTEFQVNDQNSDSINTDTSNAGAPNSNWFGQIATLFLNNLMLIIGSVISGVIVVYVAYKRKWN